MKNSKKTLILFLALLLTLTLSACGKNVDKVDNENEVENTEQESNVEEKNEEDEKKDDGPTQEELNEGLKKEAIEADFVKINGGEIEEDTKLFLEGEVSVIMSKDVGIEFMLGTEEGDGHGVYSIWAIVDDIIINEGDIVKVWGVYNGKDDAGMPSIVATIVEIQQ